MHVHTHRPHLQHHTHTHTSYINVHTQHTHTFSPAMIQRDSVSTARDSLKHRSSIRAISVAKGDDLPTSNAGEAMGESSTLKNNSPSVGLCGRGLITSHDTFTKTLSHTEEPTQNRQTFLV